MLSCFRPGNRNPRSPYLSAIGEARLLLSCPGRLGFPSVVHLLHHAIAAVASSVRDGLVPLVYPIRHRRRPHVLQRESRELAPLFHCFLHRVRHQAAQIRVPAAGRVGLTVAVAGDIQAGGTLQGQRLIDHGAKLRNVRVKMPGSHLTSRHNLSRT